MTPRRAPRPAHNDSVRGADRGMFAIIASARLVTRRIRSDGAALSAITLLIALTTVLAVVVPAQMDSTFDRAAREAVAAAGSETDLLLRTSVADPSGLKQQPPSGFLRTRARSRSVSRIPLRRRCST
jgi:hypothetical protein